VPVMGTRERDQRNHFKWQHHLLSDQPLSSNHFSEAESNVKKRTDDLFDSNLSWSDIDWIKSQTDLPIILKGIMHEQDAIIALDFNVSALIISNHGGRQLDFMPSTIEVLPAIAAVVQQKIPIMIDGGFRRGVDIFKALALGADCILLGRSVLWALAVNGTAGIIDLFDIFSRELKEVMILCGCKTIEDIKTQGKECVRLKL